MIKRKIVYVSTMCSRSKYNEFLKKSEIKLGQPAQKYHRLITSGLIKNNYEVETITGIPINRTISKKLIQKNSDEIEDDIKYRYINVINLPFVKNIMYFMGSFYKVLCLGIKKRDSIVICDVLNISISLGALLATKIIGLNNIGIVTDMPIHLCNNPNTLRVKLNNFIMYSFDNYVFLTDEMNKLINHKNKPFVVVEGQVDVDMQDIPNNLQDKYKKRICMYTGALQKKYGIEILVKGYLQANIPESELHIYGTGDFEQELIDICKDTDKIKYFGVVSTDHVVKEQIKATLLINPRPTHEEYTKYSFPSKNMEYMVSGTPVLTTKLPGMPEEYCEYIYLINSENEQGIAASLKEVLNIDKEELHRKGLSAKRFVLNKKNNIIQSEKIIRILKEK